MHLTRPLPLSPARCAIAAVAIGSALVLPGCAGYVHGDTGSPSAPAVGPQPEDLRQTLQTFSDPWTAESDRVGAVVGGETLRPALNAVEAVTPSHGEISYQVTDIRTDGDNATAQVVTSGPDGITPIDGLTWHKVDGTWKLSAASACRLAQVYADYACAP